MTGVALDLTPAPQALARRRLGRHGDGLERKPATARTGPQVLALDAVAAGLCLTAAQLALHVPTTLLVLILTTWMACLALSAGHSVFRAAALLGLVAWAASALVTLPGAPGHPQILVAGLAVSTCVVRGVFGLGRARTATARRTLAVGPRDLVARSMPLLQGRGGAGGLDVVAVCLDELDLTTFDVPCAVGLDDIDAIVDEAVAMQVETILVHPCGPLGPHELRRLAWRLEETGMTLLVAPGLVDVAAARARPGQVGDLVVLGVRPAGRGAARLLISAGERVAAGILLALLVPLLLVLGVLVRRDSPGTALFRQERVGRDGRLFTMLKLRTMSNGSISNEALSGENESDSVLFKIRQDPRITGIGRVLRRYSLDELPQLINVVRGQMSLVGPRPALPAEVALYDLDAQRRLSVKPGLTGLWQVSGRSDLSWEDTVRLDVHYVDNWTPRLDATILWRTVGAVLGHRGAY